MAYVPLEFMLANAARRPSPPPLKPPTPPPSGWRTLLAVVGVLLVVGAIAWGVLALGLS